MAAGLGALVVLVALVGGVPYALLRFAGPPIAPELLDLDLLTSSVGPSTIVAVLVLFVWIAWLQLVACVMVEVYAGVRRVGMPARVPFSGTTQALANRLVSAVLLLFTAGAVAVPIARLGMTPPAAPPVAVVAFTAPIADQHEEQPHTARVKKVYVVQPPHGRHHESLWEIAEKCLGDGRRYPEIFRLNQHKEQPDGARLRMADLIRPGWVLDMPDDAHHAHVVPADQARAQILREHPGRVSTGPGRAADEVRQEATHQTPKHHAPQRQSPEHHHQAPEQQQRQEEQGLDL
ncbi:LysM peptidoglycan-binding domain-containing protein, partial [Nonomuraea roseoviolacea]|uniref:LysM peptidoglycan-binding domain-containing protein n=1 Tax=Nonomuraea roseoviolacea TaxID=103837 RepID=UPI003CD06A55